MKQPVPFVVALLALASSGCPKADPPRELRLELPELITSKEPVMVHVRAVQQDGIARDVKDAAHPRGTTIAWRSICAGRTRRRATNSK